jgi:hypothetical protein
LEAPTFLAARQNGILMGGEDSIHCNIGLFLFYLVVVLHLYMAWWWWFILRYYSVTWWKGVRKTIKKNLNQDDHCKV